MNQHTKYMSNSGKFQSKGNPSNSSLSSSHSMTRSKTLTSSYHQNDHSNHINNIDTMTKSNTKPTAYKSYYDTDSSSSSNSYSSAKDSQSCTKCLWIHGFSHNHLSPCFSNESPNIPSKSLDPPSTYDGNNNDNVKHKSASSSSNVSASRKYLHSNANDRSYEANRTLNHHPEEEKEDCDDNDDDDEDDEGNDNEEILSRISQRRAYHVSSSSSTNNNGNGIITYHMNSKLKPPMSSSRRRVSSPNSNCSTLSTNPSIRTTHSDDSVASMKLIPIKTVEISGEPRIIAPNVSKLSPISVIEIKLQSSSECVTVQCSVDVLKMRSTFFHNLLAEQEQSKPHTSVLLTSTSSSSHSPSSSTIGQTRPTIFIEETSPFEAAAFLESLHEGRTLFKGEWNICWARLSVSWGIEDLIMEYAHQIESHIQNLLTKIQTNHWRTSPNTLSGMKIAVLRKSPTPFPTIVMGMCVDATTSTCYSKIRVAFDVEKSAPMSNPSTSLAIQTTSSSSSVKHGTTILSNTNSAVSIHLPLLSPAKADYPQSPIFYDKRNPLHRNDDAKSKSFQDDIESTSNVSNTSNHPSLNTYGSPTRLGSQPSHSHSSSSSSSSTTSNHNINNNNVNSVMSQSSHQSVFVGDIGEPFWVQSTKDGSSWYDPDDIFLMESKRLITITDKRIFWEMIRTLIELPQISSLCKGKIQNTKDVSNILRRSENRILWTNDGPLCLPRDITLDLLTNSYVIPPSIINQLENKM